jgi:hypothetical protein
MKIKQLLALALLAAAPAFASANFTVNFEKAWDYTYSDINNYYSGGTAADSTSGSNQGVSFVNVLGLSNTSDFTYYSNAPTSEGIAWAYGDHAYFNVNGGVNGSLSFYYSTPTTILGAVKAYDNLNGTGTLLGSIDLIANSTSSYDGWTKVSFNFTGTALSFDLSASANVVAFDNISAVPEPAMSWLFVTGFAAIGAFIRRRKA